MIGWSGAEAGGWDLFLDLKLSTKEVGGICSEHKKK
jgi:hypothetical protein